MRAAEHCNDCLGWLEHCHAECCTVFTFSVTPVSDVRYEGDEVVVRVPMTEDLRRYYELHGALVDGELVAVARASCAKSPGRLAVHARCHALTEDHLCSLHANGKPECCSGFTAQTAHREYWVVPSSCLFAYKPPSKVRNQDLF
jgi:hypothetical protein